MWYHAALGSSRARVASRVSEHYHRGFKRHPQAMGDVKDLYIKIRQLEKRLNQMETRLISVQLRGPEPPQTQREDYCRCLLSGGE